MTGTEVTKCFEDRLQDLIADSGKDIKTLAAEIGISSGALSKYQNDKSEAGITALYKIARYFGVTTDYLVGISDNKTPGNYHIGKRLGLTDEAIKELEAITGPGGEGIGIFYDPRHKFIINELLVSDEFFRMIFDISKSVDAGKKKCTPRPHTAEEWVSFGYDENYALLDPGDLKDFYQYESLQEYQYFLSYIYEKLMNIDTSTVRKEGALNADNPETR